MDIWDVLAQIGRAGWEARKGGVTIHGARGNKLVPSSGWDGVARVDWLGPRGRHGLEQDGRGNVWKKPRHDSCGRPGKNRQQQMKRCRG